MHRYFIDTPPVGELVQLDGPEAHHLSQVMRARVGEQVLLFCGDGCEYSAEVRSVQKRTVELTVRERIEIDREAPVAIEIAAALPKGDRQRWLVEKLVELGCARLTPLRTQREVAVPNASAVERLRRAVIEASKQCRRTRLMEIGPPQGCKEWLANPAWLAQVAADAADELPRPLTRWLAHPGGEPWESAARRLSAALVAIDPASQGSGNRRPRVQIAIGPEGGFTDEEVQRGQEAGWEIVELGPRILRVETAAAAACTIVTTVSQLRPAAGLQS